jgi:hypothetical protein
MTEAEVPVLMKRCTKWGEEKPRSKCSRATAHPKERAVAWGRALPYKTPVHG